MRTEQMFFIAMQGLLILLDSQSGVMDRVLDQDSSLYTAMETHWVCGGAMFNHSLHISHTLKTLLDLFSVGSNLTISDKNNLAYL